MGENDQEIFARLREIGEAVARIDERTARHDQTHMDHEKRIRDLERDNDRRKGALAIVGTLAGSIGGGLVYIFKTMFGGVAQ